MLVFNSLSIASFACVASLAMNSIVQAAGTNKSKWSSIKYSTVVGFFAQDLPETDDTTFDYVWNALDINRRSPRQRLRAWTEIN